MNQEHEKAKNLDFYMAMGEEPDSPAIPYELCSKEEKRHRDIIDHLFWIHNYSENSKNLLMEYKEGADEHFQAVRDYMHRADVWLDFIAKKKNNSNQYALWVIAMLLFLILIKI